MIKVTKCLSLILFGGIFTMTIALCDHTPAKTMAETIDYEVSEAYDRSIAIQEANEREKEFTDTVNSMIANGEIESAYTDSVVEDGVEYLLGDKTVIGKLVINIAKDVSVLSIAEAFVAANTAFDLSSGNDSLRHLAGII